jgi:hypothetical protein
VLRIGGAENLVGNVEQNVDVAESRSAGGAGGPATALIHIGRPMAMAAAVAMFATAVRLCGSAAGL